MRNYIYGKNSCKNALVRNNTIKNIFLLDGFKDPTIYKIIKEKKFKFEYLSSKQMENLVGRNNHQGIIIGSNRQVGLTNIVGHVSTGAIEYAKVCKVTNLNQTINTLKENGYWIVASDGLANMSYKDVDYKMKSAIIIGSEGKGIGPLLLKNSDFITKIPIVGHVNSLNASVAAALYFNAVLESKNNVK